MLEGLFGGGFRAGAKFTSPEDTLGSWALDVSKGSRDQPARTDPIIIPPEGRFLLRIRPLPSRGEEGGKLSRARVVSVKSGQPVATTESLEKGQSWEVQLSASRGGLVRVEAQGTGRFSIELLEVNGPQEAPQASQERPTVPPGSSWEDMLFPSGERPPGPEPTKNKAQPPAPPAGPPLEAQHLHVLGLKGDEDNTTIKKRWRALAMRYHPDRCKEADAEAKFKKAKEAYEALAKLKGFPA